MKTTTEKSFDTLNFFRNIKAKLAEKLATMSLEEQKEFLKKVREGKIKIVWSTPLHYNRTLPRPDIKILLRQPGNQVKNEKWKTKNE